MYEIEFYEKENGESDVWNFLEEYGKNRTAAKIPEYSINS